MSTLTKDQILKLTPEQQDAVAVLELAQAKRGQRLWEEARRCRGQGWVFMATLLILQSAVSFALYFPKIQPWIPFFLMFLLWGMISFHANTTNRRLAALMAWLELDKKKDENPNAS